MNRFARKEVDIKKAEEALKRLKEEKEEKSSVGKFIRTYFHELEATGKPIKRIYEFLKANGIEVGTCGGFSSLYSKMRKERKTGQQQKKQEKRSSYLTGEGKEPNNKYPEAAITETAENRQEIQAFSNINNKVDTEENNRNRGLGLRPIYAPDGTELTITENGAKTFEIKKTKRQPGT